MLQAPLPSCGHRITNFWRIVEPEPLKEEIFDRDQVTKVNNVSQTPLHIVVAKGRLEPVERILDSMYFNAKTFAEKDLQNRTVLHYAASLPDLTIFQTLIEHPFATADVLEIQDENGQTALDIIADRCEIEMLDRLGFAKDVWSKRDPFGQTILHRNMLYASATQIRKILHHPNMTATIFDAVNHEGQSAFHLAALSRSPDKLEAVLTHPFITPALVCLKDKHALTAKQIFLSWPQKCCPDPLQQMRIISVFEQFIEKRKIFVQRFLPPLKTESGLHYKALAGCFYPNDYPYLSFASILNKSKRIEQIRILGKNLASNLHKFRSTLDRATVHQEKNFRVEVRFVQNLYRVILINQENWFGAEETEIFHFEHFTDQKLQDFIGLLWGSPFSVRPGFIKV